MKSSSAASVTNRREPIFTLRSSPESISSYNFVRPMPRRAITAGTAISVGGHGKLPSDGHVTARWRS